MSWIVTPNLITVTLAESINGWSAAGTTLSVGTTLDPDINWQGAGCISWGVKSIGPHYFYVTNSASPTAVVDARNQHLYLWFNSTATKLLDTYANIGLGIMLGTGAAAWSINTTAVWATDGSDTYFGGWKCYALDLNRQPDFSGSSWTASAIQNIHKWGMFVSCSSTPSRTGITNMFIDAIRYGSGLQIYSGSSATPANWEALYQSDYTGSNKYGIVDKRGGVYFIQGQVQIGASGSTVPTYFVDSNQIVEFESKYVSASHYRIDITGSLTTCSLGNVVGAGVNSIGVNPVIIRGAPDFKRIKPTKGNGPASFTQSLRPTINLDPSVKQYFSYATRYDTVGEVNIGVSGSATNVSQYMIVDNTYATTYPLTFYPAAALSLSLNNKIVSATQSFIPPSASYAIVLYNTGTVDASQFAVLNSYGFTSVAQPTTQSFTLTNQIFTSNTPYVSVYANKTWNLINPTWATPTTNSLRFWNSQSNFVNELYSFAGRTVTPAGVSIPSSSIYIYEGSLTRSIVNRAIGDITGSSYFNILKTVYIASGSTASPGYLASSSYGGFVIKAYRYGYTPYLASNAVTAPINTSIAFVTDPNITNLTASVAAALSGSIYTNKRTNPVTVMKYVSGSTAFSSGSVVTGSLSNAKGYVVEYLGTAGAGTVVLDRRDTTKFVEKDVLIVGTTPYATASLSSSNAGFSGSYTWIIDCNANSLADVYDYHAARMAEWPITASFEEVLKWGASEQTQLLYEGGSGHYTERNVAARQGVWLAKAGAGTIAYQTADEGVVYYPPVQYTLTLTGLVAGTEVRIYKKADRSVIAGSETTGTTFTYNYTYEGDILAYIQIISVEYVDILIDNYTITNANASIPIQQQFDRNYKNLPP